jgi:hypothetical protein
MKKLLNSDLIREETLMQGKTFFLGFKSLSGKDLGS